VTANPGIYVIAGTQGAGKSTVARLLAERWERGAWVSADALQQMIVAGRVWPEGAAMSGEAELQLWLRLKNACLLAESFVEQGISAVIDDIVIGERVDHLLAMLAGRSFRFVMLTPRLEVVREREAGRGTQLWEQWEWLDTEVRTRTQRLGLWLDNSEQTPAETVDEILRRADEALVTAPERKPGSLRW
jgi:predicted kinase